jgi:hypothetical protein
LVKYWHTGQGNSLPVLALSMICSMAFVLKYDKRGYFVYNTKFITVDGKDLYPGYLGREQRVLIRNRYSGKRNICGVHAVRTQDFIIKSVRI